MDVNLRLKLHMVATCPTYLIMWSYFHILTCIVLVIFLQHIREIGNMLPNFKKNYQITLQPSAQTNIRYTRWHGAIVASQSAEPYIRSHYSQVHKQISETQGDTEWHYSQVQNHTSVTQSDMEQLLQVEVSHTYITTPTSVLSTQCTKPQPLAQKL